MQNYLATTYMCDHDDPWLLKLVEEITNGAITPVEKARHIVADFLYKQMPPTASHFWPECFLEGRWISCEAFLDKPLYDGMLKQGLITEDQVPTIEWDGESDLVILKAWITEQCGSISSAEDAIAHLERSEEGMPPLWIEKIIAPIFYPLNLRYSDTIRQFSRGSG
jgi:hypothetical protein